MLISRKTIVAGEVTAFTFERYESPTVLIKNETDGEILFCDTPFDEDKALHLPAHSWQSINITIQYGATPALYVRGAVDGAVEIDFGSDGMGCLDMVRLLAISGLMPILTVESGDGTTLTAEITRKHGSVADLDTPISVTTGSALFVGDTLTLTVEATDPEDTASLSVNGDDQSLDENGKFALVITGDVSAASGISTPPA